MNNKLYIVGMGPGDPELVTRKAERILRDSSLIAYFTKKGETSHAYRIASTFLLHKPEALKFEYPITTEKPHTGSEYQTAMQVFYDDCAKQLSNALQRGLSPALLCEGDPMLYGSAIYLFDRLNAHYPIEIIPGISAMSGCWSNAKLPIVRKDQALDVIPATLPIESLTERLKRCDAAVIMKIGRNLEKIKSALKAVGLFERAFYIERGTQIQQQIMALSALESCKAPYFSLILIPGRAKP